LSHDGVNEEKTNAVPVDNPVKTKKVEQALNGGEERDKTPV